MKKRYVDRTKRLVGLIVLLLVAFSAVSCGGQVNAQVFDDAEDWMKDSFRNENRTYGAFYGDTVAEDEALPQERVFLVKSEEDYDRIFVDTPDGLEVDFAKDMLIVYTFTTLYHRKVTVEDMSLDGEEGSLTLSMEKPSEPVGDASRPFQRFVVVKTEKTAATTVTVRMVDG